MQYGDVLILNKTRRSFALFSLAQTSFEKHEEIVDFRIEQPEETLENQESIEEVEDKIEELEKEYNLTQETKWINLKGEEKIEFRGRAIGGCLDCVKVFIGTKYDKVKNYIETYKEDGIVWFLEVFEIWKSVFDIKSITALTVEYVNTLSNTIWNRTKTKDPKELLTIFHRYRERIRLSHHVI